MVLGTLATNAQQRFDPLFPACSTQDPNSKEYRDYFFEQIMSDLDYRGTYLSYVNRGLRESGEDKNVNGGKPLDSRYIQTIINHTSYSMVTIPEGVSFTNTRKDRHTGKVEEYEDDKQKEFMAGTFNYKTCHLTFLKSNCFNFIKLHHLAPQVVLAEETLPTPVKHTVVPQTIVKTVEYIYIKDTLYLEKEKIVYRDREVEREKIAAETHMSQSQSQSFSHSRANSNDIESVIIEEGPQWSFGVSGGGYNRNYQSNGGLLGAVCDVATGGQGSAGVSYKGRSTVQAYKNSSSSSSNTATSSASASSLNQGGNQFGNANNQNQQNQNQSRQQSGGRPQPIYGADPNSFVGSSRTGP